MEYMILANIPPQKHQFLLPRMNRNNSLRIQESSGDIPAPCLNSKLNNMLLKRAKITVNLHASSLPQGGTACGVKRGPTACNSSHRGNWEQIEHPPYSVSGEIAQDTHSIHVASRSLKAMAWLNSLEGLRAVEDARAHSNQHTGLKNRL